jgi:hypothetical protein
MASETDFMAARSIRRTFLLWVCWALAAGTAPAQSEQSLAYGRAEQRFHNIGSVAEAVKKVKEGNFTGVHVEEIVHARAVEAIPALRAQFGRTIEPSHSRDIDPGNKAEIASALVRLGDKDATYWDFLVNGATAALDSAPPFPRESDPQGRLLDDHFSPAFLQWAKGQGLSLSDASQKAMYELPGKLVFLGETGDPRGLPILRRAMSSSDYVIQIMAAKGLAKLQDRASVPLIIAACEKSAWAAPAIAEALVYVDDPQAQIAAEKYLPKKLLESLRETKNLPGNDAFFH